MWLALHEYLSKNIDLKWPSIDLERFRAIMYLHKYYIMEDLACHIHEGVGALLGIVAWRVTAHVTTKSHQATYGCRSCNISLTMSIPNPAYSRDDVAPLIVKICSQRTQPRPWTSACLQLWWGYLQRKIAMLLAEGCQWRGDWTGAAMTTHGVDCRDDSGDWTLLQCPSVSSPSPHTCFAHKQRIGPEVP